MGKILSKYRRVKSPSEELECLEEEIKTIEDRHKSTLQAQKSFIYHFILWGIVFYLAVIACVYTLSLLKPKYIAGLLTYPVLLYFSVRAVNWGYRRNVSREKELLIKLRAKKKKILDEVMDKETYKVAMEILEKYAPDQIRKPGGGLSPPKPVKTQQISPPKPQNVQPTNQGLVQRQRVSPQRPLQSTPPQRRLVRPILNQNRGVIERVLDAIVGDGFNNRYALICANCSFHNGMALQDEFEYLAFRCAYCGFPNPSRKVKPRSSSSPSPNRGASAQGDVKEEPQEKLAEEESASSVELSESKEENPVTETEEEPSQETPVEKETENSEGKNLE